MIDQTKNFMIGVFVVAAISLIVFIILFIHPTVGNEGKMLKVRFANIDKVNEGTRVTFGGRPVGEVVDIQEIIEDPYPREARNGTVYVYELTLAVDSSIEVYNTDEISLRTSGLLGEKSVNITPLPPMKGQDVKKVTSEVIYANETGSVEETFKEFKEVADKLEAALDDVMEVIKDIKEAKIIPNLGDTIAHIKNITGSLDQPDKWSSILDNVDEITRSANNSWPKIDETINSLADAADNARSMTEDGKEIVAAVKDGKGTVGKAIMTDEMYLQLSSILAKGETLMNDVNHYGVLFHLDKNWQRLRARRVNLLQRLCSPQEFRNFFNDEIDQIQTSLARVNMILDESGVPCGNPCLVRNLEFVKVFSELLRRTEEIEENLKLYNIQLNECRVRETELSSCSTPRHCCH